MATATGSVSVGTVGVICPVCDTEIPVLVTATIHADEDACRHRDSRATMECTPDLTDLWAHMWTHDER